MAAGTVASSTCCAIAQAAGGGYWSTVGPPAAGRCHIKKKN